jgi:isoleucyl-tRNA synthetase
MAESIYKGVRGEKESVHLDEWPKLEGSVDEGLIDDMAEVRRLASLALELRQKAGIKVRQPLARLTTVHEKLKDKAALVRILLDEINVKELLSNKKQDDEVVLDTALTEELKKEGQIRDVVRAVQDIRKKKGLMPEDNVELVALTDEKGKEVIERAKEDLKQVAGVVEISYKAPKETFEVRIDTIDIACDLLKK